MLCHGRKLMGHTPTFADLAEVHPEIHCSLTQLQNMSAEEVSALGLQFQVSAALILKPNVLQS